MAANSTTLQASSAKRRPVDGDRRLRRIARAGKQWKRTMGRRVDMEGEYMDGSSYFNRFDHPLLCCGVAYVYRLVLEYVRVSSEDRETSNFVL